jgi:hypothetical protein
MKRLLQLLIVIVVVSGLQVSARAVQIDFEDFSKDTVITDQYAHLGVTFKGEHSDIFVASEQGSCDPTWGCEFPPHSGINSLVASDWEQIIFSVPVSYVSFYYTNGHPAGFEAFAYDDEENLLESITYYWDLSDLSHIIYANNNYGYTNTQKPLLPNMLAEFTALNIKYIDLQPNLHGDGLVIDDLSFTPVSTPVPEPSTLLLLGSGVVLVVGIIKRLIKI